MQLTTNSKQATSESERACPPGTYAPTRVDGGPLCFPCPDGLSCERTNISQANIVPAGSSALSLGLPLSDGGARFQHEGGQADDALQASGAAWRPGGPPGACESNRDPELLACGGCPVDAFAGANDICRSSAGEPTGALTVCSAIAGFVPGPPEHHDQPRYLGRAAVKERASSPRGFDARGQEYSAGDAGPAGAPGRDRYLLIFLK